MNMELVYTQRTTAHKQLFYFEFEKQFMEMGMRCIPMVVRYKLDIVGIKLSLEVWSKLDHNDRYLLASLSTESISDMIAYEYYLSWLIQNITHTIPTRLSKKYVLPDPGEETFKMILVKCTAYGIAFSWSEWMRLTALERFALSKLLKPGHESKNFIPALKEFGLLP